MKTITKQQYERMKAGDVVLTGGDSLFAKIIRRITKGKNAAPATSATHAGIVVEVGNQKLIAEMTATGFVFSPFSKYTEESRDRWIVDVVSVAALNSYRVRSTMNNTLCEMYRRKKEIKYDWRGVVSFLPVRVSQSESRFFCSELAAFLWSTVAGVAVQERPEQISPNEFEVGSKVIKGIFSIL